MSTTIATQSTLVPLLARTFTVDAKTVAKTIGGARFCRGESCVEEMLFGQQATLLQLIGHWGTAVAVAVGNRGFTFHV